MESVTGPDFHLIYDPGPETRNAGLANRITDVQEEEAEAVEKLSP